MAQWTPVQKSLHQNTYWKAHTSYSFAQQDTTAPLLIAEIAHALPFYPMAFIKVGEQFQFVTLHSLQPALNLFVNPQGKWRVPYVPSVYRGYPFAMLKNEQGEQIFCFDKASGLFNETGEGTPLFAEAQQLSEKTNALLGFFQQCEQNKQLTQNAVNCLAEHQLIVPWPIHSKTEEGETQAIEGVYRVDETALLKLPAEALQQLQQHQALTLAYGQLYSQARLQGLGQLYRIHQVEQSNLKQPEVNLDQLFGGAEEDIFKF